MKSRFGVLKAAWADLLDNRRHDRIGVLQVVDRFAVADRRGQCHTPRQVRKRSNRKIRTQEERRKSITQANVKRMKGKRGSGSVSGLPTTHPEFTRSIPATTFL